MRAIRDTTFTPITLVIETESELKALRAVAARHYTVARAIAAVGDDIIAPINQTLFNMNKALFSLLGNGVIHD